MFLFRHLQRGQSGSVPPAFVCLSHESGGAISVLKSEFIHNHYSIKAYIYNPYFVESPGIYNVGKAAVVPPVFVCLSHKPEGASRTIAWVGKGIVYDTGGLSIKGKVS